MSIIGRIFPWFRWHYVASVKTQTNYVNAEGVTTSTFTGYFILRERGDGKRRFEFTGSKHSRESPYGRYIEVQVMAWRLGGPIPIQSELAAPASNPAKKINAKLIVFPGGKGGAA